LFSFLFRPGVAGRAKHDLQQPDTPRRRLRFVRPASGAGRWKKMNKKRAERLENLPQVPAENGKIISDLRRRNY